MGVEEERTGMKSSTTLSSSTEDSGRVGEDAQDGLRGEAFVVTSPPSTLPVKADGSERWNDSC